MTRRFSIHGAVPALLPALLMAMACAVFVLGSADFAEARRFGGGRSFGSKPLFSRSAPRPAPSRQKSFGTQQTQRRPGMGGLLGGMLMGGLIGSLFFGGGFGGINLFDILIIGGLIWLGMRLLSRRAPPVQRGTDRTLYDDDQVGPREASNAYRRAQEAWNMVRTQPEPQPRPGPHAAAGTPGPIEEPAQVHMPEGFDAEEFLEGAKMCFTRLQQSWAVRDADDIRQFTTDAVFNEILRQMQEDPEPAPVEVLMVNARILEVTDDGPLTRATVYFDVLLREERDQGNPADVREVWHFLRDSAVEHSMWHLDGIQQVQ